MVKQLGYEISLTNDFIYKLLHQLLISELLGTSFITSNPIDLRILNDMNKDILKDNNILLANNLQTIIPFAFDVPIDKLLLLRNRERESFLLFRNSINQALTEFSPNSKISKIMLNDFRFDVLEPILTLMDIKVKEAKKDISKNLATMAITGILTFGIYSGFPQNDIFKLAELLGFSNVIKSAISNISSPENSIRKDNFYFLWKLRENSKSKNLLSNILI